MKNNIARFLKEERRIIGLFILCILLLSGSIFLFVYRDNLKSDRNKSLRENISLQDFEIDKNFHFPLFISSKEKYNNKVDHINSLLRKEFEIDSLQKEKVKASEETTQTRSIVTMEYVITYLSPQVIQISFNVEGCGAYCEKYKKYILIDIDKEKLITLEDILNKQGLNFIENKIDDYQRETIAKFIESNASKNISIFTTKERSLQNTNYQKCLEGISDKTIHYDQFFFEDNFLIIERERCFPHVIQALDSLDIFTIKIKIDELLNFFTNYFEDLDISRNSTKIISFDKILAAYLQQTENVLVKTNKEKDYAYFDRQEYYKNEYYNIYFIGHTETEENGTQSRQIHDAWVYINIKTRELYELDKASEDLRLIPFKFQPVL